MGTIYKDNWIKATFNCFFDIFFLAKLYSGGKIIDLSDLTGPSLDKLIDKMAEA